MRARHRHFNARDAGSGAVFDARFIQGISNNQAVTNWPDRSRNGWNATPLVTSPILLVNGLNGSPCVSFNNTPMIFAGQSYFRNKSDGYLMSITRNSSSGGDGNQLAFQFSTNAASDPTRLGIVCKLGTNITYITATRILDSGGATITFSNIASNQVNRIVEAVAEWTGGKLSIAIDGIIRAESINPSTGLTSNTDSFRVNIGGSASQRLIGEVALAQAFDTNPNSSLKKRIRHAAAYSFKISCN